MSEKLCLKWNDFQENVNTAFVNLRGNIDFSDVTLACEDGQQFEAHKVILVASSPFFHHLLKMNKHSHPLIYMRGIKSEDMSAIIDFLYCGEANVFQENLDSFLAIAEELKLKGLMGQTDDGKDKFEKSHASQFPMKTKIKTSVKRDQEQLDDFKNVCTDQQILNVDKNFEQRMVAIPSYLSGDLKELDEQVKSMMEKSKNMIQHGKSHRKTATICKVCGKEGDASSIRDHIEAHHMEGISIPCNVCEKSFRSRVSLRKHKCEWNKMDFSGPGKL